MGRPRTVEPKHVETFFGVDVARILRISRASVNVHLRAGRLRDDVRCEKIDPQKGPPYDPRSVLELALARAELTDSERMQELFEEKANVLEIAGFVGHDA